jgi:hypothetical protein
MTLPSRYAAIEFLCDLGALGGKNPDPFVSIKNSLGSRRAAAPNFYFAKANCRRRCAPGKEKQAED